MIFLFIRVKSEFSNLLLLEAAFILSHAWARFDWINKNFFNEDKKLRILCVGHFQSKLNTSQNPTFSLLDVDLPLLKEFSIANGSLKSTLIATLNGSICRLVALCASLFLSPTKTWVRVRRCFATALAILQSLFLRS